MPWRKTLMTRLTMPLLALIDSLSDGVCAELEEIRIYAGYPVRLTIDGNIHKTTCIVRGEEMDEVLAALSGYALYSCETQMADGYIPLPGGHRAGICGRRVQEANGSWRMCGVSSICIRIARHIPGASREIRPYLLSESGQAQRILLFGPPGCGKTTVLRDAALYLAEDVGLHAAVADEREELFAALRENGGYGLDVLSGCTKAQTMPLLLRSMAPHVIITDEIGSAGDVQALKDVVRCGVGVITSGHAEGFSALLRRPMLRKLFDASVFDRYIQLGRRGCVVSVHDAEGGAMVQMESGKLQHKD